MTDTIAVPAPAKINLFLHITGRRDDGYHLLQTVFQLLDYGDILYFDKLDQPALELQTAIPALANDSNLVLKAARLLQQHCGIQRGARIRLDKRLPLGGGVGGGSSNAATTLLALNKLWQLELSLSELAALGLQLGADVPVFVKGRTAWAEGIGEQLQAVEIPESYYLVVKPACEVATDKIFSAKQLTRHTPPITIAAFFEQGTHNDCEPVVRDLYPEVDQALTWLNQHRPAQMTGTGACIFSRCDSEAQARQLLQQLPPPLSGFVARGINQSPAHLCLGYGQD